MKTMTKLTMGLAVLLCIGVAGAGADTVTFGEGGGGWANQGVNDEVSNTETASVEVVTGITFNLGIQANSGTDVGITGQNNLVSGSQNVWASGDGTLTFTLSIADNSGSLDLDTLSFNEIEIGALNGDGEYVTMSESASSNTEQFDQNYTSGITEDDLYVTGSLTDKLSESNYATWDLTGESTGAKVGGVEHVVLDYSVIPEPATFGLIGLMGIIYLLRRKFYSDK